VSCDESSIQLRHLTFFAGLPIYTYHIQNTNDHLFFKKKDPPNPKTRCVFSVGGSKLLVNNESVKYMQNSPYNNPEKKQTDDPTIECEICRHIAADTYT
jgi:hypothetical protein